MRDNPIFVCAAVLPSLPLLWLCPRLAQSAKIDPASSILVQKDTAPLYACSALSHSLKRGQLKLHDIEIFKNHESVRIRVGCWLNVVV